MPVVGDVGHAAAFEPQQQEILVIDDWAMAPLSETERRDFWEICEDRYQVRSTILTSQLPVARWHEQIGHNAHRIESKANT